MRLVLDTSVMVAAFRSRYGAARQLVRLVPLRRFDVVITPALFLEYEAVLTREEHMAVHRFSLLDIEEFLLYFATFTEKTRIHYNYRPQLRDTKDEMVLEAAVNGQADAIVTYNVRDFLPAAHRFGIEVLTPGSILKERVTP
jgi:putative PIN family toxin of toxin-antitoxin system